MRKLLPVILAVVCAAMLCCNFAAADRFTEGDYTYIVENGEATITLCDKTVSGEITIPATLGGYPVTSIGDHAFDGCGKLTGVTLPESVTKVGEAVFAACGGLAKVTIQGELTAIGVDMFYNCYRLSQITIPESVTEICEGAFFNCYGLPEITIPGSVTTIGASAFAGCGSLEALIIPEGVTTIGEGAFTGCVGVTQVVIPESVTTIEQLAFYNCNELTNVIYCGTESQWSAIQMGEYNEQLVDAPRQYHAGDATGAAEQTCRYCGKNFTAPAAPENQQPQPESDQNAPNWIVVAILVGVALIGGGIACAVLLKKKK